MQNLFLRWQKIIKTNLSNISFLALSLLIAFIFGNFFGLYSKRISEPFLFMTSTLISVELINFFNFSNRLRVEQYYFLKNNILFTTLNTIKRGFLIGIFVEAFKVGS